jgi:hypothetical protein
MKKNDISFLYYAGGLYLKRRSFMRWDISLWQLPSRSVIIIQAMNGLPELKKTFTPRSFEKNLNEDDLKIAAKLEDVPKRLYDIPVTCGGRGFEKGILRVWLEEKSGSGECLLSHLDMGLSVTLGALVVDAPLFAPFQCKGFAVVFACSVVDGSELMFQNSRLTRM